MQLKLFTEEMFPSVNRCLNPYMFFPLGLGAKGLFCDLFPLPSGSTSGGVFVAIIGCLSLIVGFFDGGGGGQ